jgi:hypothetical protein
MKTIPAAFAAFPASSLLVGGITAAAFHNDGDAIAVLSLPAGHGITRTDDPGETLKAMEENHGRPAYRFGVEVAKISALAAAAGQECVILEMPEHGGSVMRILTPDGAATIGWLMPQGIPEGMAEGLLLAPSAPAPGTGKAKAAIPPAALPAPVVIASAERKTIEIDFGGKPADEIRLALKAPELGGRWSGRGTRRGIPASRWYLPDNPFTRQKIAEILGVTIAQAA